METNATRSLSLGSKLFYQSSDTNNSSNFDLHYKERLAAQQQNQHLLETKTNININILDLPLESLENNILNCSNLEPDLLIRNNKQTSLKRLLDNIGNCVPSIPFNNENIINLQNTILNNSNDDKHNCYQNSLSKHLNFLSLSNSILKYRDYTIQYSLNSSNTLIHSMNRHILYIFFLFFILFNTQLTNGIVLRNIRSLSDVTTTEHSKINTPTFTLNDYNQAIRQQMFNNPHAFCGDPPLVPNAQSNLYLHHKHYPIGQEVNYVCEPGYKALGGSSVTRCIHVHIPSAGHISFPDVFQLSNDDSQSGVVSQGSNRSKNSKRLSDLDEEPELNANGQRLFPNDFNDKRKMSRKSDDELYDLEGPSVKKEQAHWYPSVTLNCQIINCTDPGQVEHAQRNDPKSGILSFNSNVHYVCEDGYEMIGSPILTCLSDGTWNGSPPKCRLKQCPILPELKNGSIIYSDSDRRINSRADYYCKPGFRLNASNNTRFCGPNNRWSSLEQMLYISNINSTNPMNDSYQCLQITCPTPARPHNGLLIIDLNRRQPVNKNIFLPGDIIIYNCVSNLMRATAKCRPDGEWSEEMPHCPTSEFSSLKCIPITSFTHGTVKVEQNRAHFSCNEGYELDGNDMINCNSKGIWSGPLPRCVIRMTLPQTHFSTTSNSSHISDLNENDSLEKQEHYSISKTLIIFLIFICILLFILIGIAMIGFYRWRQRKLNSKTWQRYFGHYYHRQSKTNIVLSTQFGNSHLNTATINSTESSNTNVSARLLQRGRSHSKSFPKSGYLQSSFSSADENTADVKSFTTETITSERARTISTYVDDTCPEDDEYDEEEDNISIYKSTTFPISAKQHNSLPLDILSSSSRSSPTYNDNVAKRTLSSGNDHIYSNIQQPLSPNVISPTTLIFNKNLSKENMFNNGIPVTDL